MSQLVKLSFNLDLRDPLPPAIPPVEIKRLFDVEAGDVANGYILHFANHSGTHVDAPQHVDSSGFSITQFEMHEFIFKSPLFINLDLEDDELIRPEHLKPHRHELEGCDLLMIKTGYSEIRSIEPQRYCLHSPGFSIAGAGYLRRFSNLRAFGMDTISFACLAYLDEGMEAHEVLLGGEGRRFLIMEDVDLSADLSNIERVILMPWLIEGIDSAPCSLVGIRGEPKC